MRTRSQNQSSTPDDNGQPGSSNVNPQRRSSIVSEEDVQMIGTQGEGPEGAEHSPLAGQLPPEVEPFEFTPENFATLLQEAKEQQRQAKQRKLFQELREYKAGLRAEMPDIGEFEQDTVPRGRKRPASEDLVAQFAKLSKTNNMVKLPDPYDGTGGAKELRRFINGLNIYFEAHNVPEDSESRILNSASLLRKKVQDKYVLAKATITTWNKFHEFLKDQLKDPTIRLAEATQRSQFIKQRDNQSVQDLVIVLENAEAEVEAAQLTAEELRAQRFLNALNNDLRTAVLSAPAEERTTREKMVTTAIKHEQLLASKKKEKAAEKPKPNSGAGQTQADRTPNAGQKPAKNGAKSTPRNSASKKAGRRSTSRTWAAKGSATSEVTCNRCGRKGHKKSDCFAVTHVDGYDLTDPAPVEKPKPAP